MNNLEIIIIALIIWFCFIKPKESFSIRQTLVCRDDDPISTECSRQILLKDLPNIVKSISKINKLTKEKSSQLTTQLKTIIETNDDVVNNMTSEMVNFTCLNNNCNITLRNAIKKVISKPPNINQLQQFL
jgi:hypothetical protein